MQLRTRVDTIVDYMCAYMYFKDKSALLPDGSERGRQDFHFLS
jgi:hypothetical protein